MMKRVVTAAAALGLAVTLMAPLGATNPGVVFQIEFKDVGSSAPPQTMTASIEGQLLKVDVPAEGSNAPNAMIFRGDRREMIMVDHSNRSYMVMDEATMKQMAAQLNSAMAQMRQMLETMPPERRAAMEEMMRGRGMGAAMGAPAAPTEMRRTSETATHSGFPTVKYEVTREGRKVREHWITEWTRLPGAEEIRTAFEGMAAFMKELLGPLQASGFGGGMSLDVYDQMREMNGYPVLTVEFDDNGQPENETRLVSASEQTVPLSTFEAPEGYRRQTMGGMGGR